MGWSAVTRFNAQSVDQSSPGAPGLASAVVQTDKVWDFNVQLPTADHDGTALTGLTGLSVVSGAMVDGVDPSEGLSFDEILLLPGTTKVAVALTPDQAGAVVPIQTNVVNMGGFDWFAMAVTDGN